MNSFAAIEWDAVGVYHGLYLYYFRCEPRCELYHLIINWIGRVRYQTVNLYSEGRRDEVLDAMGRNMSSSTAARNANQPGLTHSMALLMVSNYGDMRRYGLLYRTGGGKWVSLSGLQFCR